MPDPVRPTMEPGGESHFEEQSNPLHHTKKKGYRMGIVTPLKTKDKPSYPWNVEAPRFSCAPGGVYMATLATFGAVPILHSGAGCGMFRKSGQDLAGGLNGAGPNGKIGTPCSCMVDEEHALSGEEKLRDLVRTTAGLPAATSIQSFPAVCRRLSATMRESQPGNSVVPRRSST